MEAFDEKDYESTSLAKGVFAFKKGKLARKDASQRKPKSRKRNRAKAKASVQKSIKGHVTEEDKTWEKAMSMFDSIQRKMFADVLGAVVNYCKESSSLNASTIPTCTLLTGINLDHEDFFKYLRDDLSQNVTPHIASLRLAATGTDGTSLTQRALIQTTVSQLLQLECPFSDDDDEDEEEDNDEGELQVKKSNLVLPTLEAWYCNLYMENCDGSSPKKRSRGKQENTQPPLVIILEDFESFPASLLQNYILNIVEYSSKLPFIFIFGVATTLTSVHQKLPHFISTHLSLEKFTSQRSTDMLSSLVESIVMNAKVPFKLGHKCLTLLIELFLFSDFSVKRFLSGYKYCLSEHFSNSTLAKKFCMEDADVKSLINKLSPKELDRCRSLPSFRRYVEEKVQERAVLLLNDDQFKIVLWTLWQDLEDATMRIDTLSKFIFELTKDLPGQPLGKQLHGVYLNCLHSNIIETHAYSEAFQLLSFLPSSALLEKLEAFIRLTDGAESPLLKPLKNQACIFLERLQTIMSSSSVSQPSTPKNGAQPTSVSQLETPKSGQKLSRADLKEQLLKSAREKKKQVSPYEALRKEVNDFFHSTIRDFAINPTKLPFFELKYFSQSSKIQRHLMAFPRGVIKTALEDPVMYLEDESLEISSRNEVLDSFPDVSVAYKLHAEMGSLINLYDWLQAWLSIVVDSEEQEDTSEIDPVLQARFTESVSALQYLGFVKPSKRKTDHMQRLTWGQ